MELNWDSLSFDFNETGGENLRQYYRDGRWSEPEYTTSEYIPVHMCSACLNYGLQAFEGIKAFRGVDGRVRLFRPDAVGTTAQNPHRYTEEIILEEETIMETVIKVEGMMCPHCKAAVEKACKAVPGTLDAVVDLQAKNVTITGTADVAALKAAIVDAGYEIAE